MRLAYIRGYVTSTVKHKSFTGARLLIAQPVDENDLPDGAPQVVVDPLGVALHEKVIICSDGSYARVILKDPRSPCRWWIMGIVDESVKKERRRMRLATVIGRVTLSMRHSSLKGERLLVALPWGPKTAQTGRDHDYSIVVYDQYGANPGSTIGVCESTEATRPFEKPTPVDAYCAAIIDQVFYQATDPHA